MSHNEVESKASRITMAWAKKTDSKRTTSPFESLCKSAPAQVMAPRLMVIFSTIALVVLGVVMVYSSSSIASLIEQGDAIGEALKQCLFVVIGVVAALCVLRFGKVDFLKGAGGHVFWGACVLLLVLTSILGTVGLGARRWLIIGPISIQISEFAKIAFIIEAARIAQEYRDGEIDIRQTVYQAIIFILAPLAFLFVTQSDFGTTLICCVGLVVVVWLSGLSNRSLFAIIAVGVVLALLAIMLTSYRADRMMSFLDPWSDEQNSGYQLVRSFKAFAAGGLFGVGIGNSYEKLQYLPEAETDFIFSIIGEELGLVGAIAVIITFLVFLRGGLLIASQARSPFGGFIAAGLTTMIAFQAFLNIACVVGLAPTTGKPLPFISSGGSSMISSLMLVGVILAISFDSHNEGEYRQRRKNLHVVSAYSSTAQRQGSTMRNRRISQSGYIGKLPKTSKDAFASFRVIRSSQEMRKPSGIQGRSPKVSRR